MSGATLLGHSLIIGVSDLSRVDILADSISEWAAGNTDRFGVTFIDFESKEKKRYPKKSAAVIKELFGHMIKGNS